MIRSLLLLCVLLSGIIAAEIADRTGLAQASAGMAATPLSRPARPLAPVLARSTDQWLPVVLARPLFAPDRRPAAHVGSVDPSVPRLSGIVVSADASVAIFQSSADARATVARQGTLVNGWNITRIGADAVDLQKAAEHLVLRPRFSDLSGAAAQTPPRTRWEAAAPKGVLRERWSNPHLQP